MNPKYPIKEVIFQWDPSTKPFHKNKKWILYNKFSKFIEKNKSDVDKCCIYAVCKINYSSCNKIYFVGTFRNVNIRLCEHKKSFYLRDNKSHFSSHLVAGEHKFTNFTFTKITTIRLLCSNRLKLIDSWIPIKSYRNLMN